MRSIGLVLSFALPMATLHAQSVAPDSGARVRIHVTDAQKSRVVTGTLLSQDADSVTLLEEARTDPVAASSRFGPPGSRVTGGRRISILRPQISRLEVSTGRHSSAGAGALIGGVIGVTGGTVLGVANLCSSSDSFLCFESPGQVVALAVVTGILGAGIGAIAGAFVHHEKWVTASGGSRASMIILPSEQGAALGLSITF
jgi:hypothetical protein